ncbi:alpha/beta hydrolase family esterase [Candidatus Thiodictyon syntrophicum]|jgi:poly(hydroxyalkanoate) depolymerase family esterase|uniref:Esterase n=1 Tax=Candidatus Thiodictyon syntrophicum TaxID=1166950 RepID=A0A2K8UB09_9GAMM|nr:PHB depolymerase family esterase [Candidatus Thiodictyon syntrophicum]AUB82764.1 esterase [Candidatus Thiodictyon syntrophicum]
MNEQMLAGMREAMSLLQRDGPVAATDKIQQTLLRLMPAATPGGQAAWRGDGAAARPARLPPVVEPVGFLPDLLARLRTEAPGIGTRLELPTAPRTDRQEPDSTQAPGRFLTGSFTNQAGTRAYKLYVPTACHGQPLPLVVMLHGGGQSADDFAAGTRFNEIAEAQPCLVLYPTQSAAANATRCWNWFKAPDQQRDQGEPSLIAGMTRAVIEQYHVDPARVYCAGLSAGGAMAVIMGATYPEVYAAVGAHSGMPYAVASDFTSAFAAMNGAAAPAAGACLKGVPLIVFHGERDETVHPRNSDHIVAQAIGQPAAARITQGRAGTGHNYTHSTHQGPDGKVLAEQWLVHGAGHAWSGGSRRGSFTDEQGPDASREMMRFFAAQSRPVG